MESIKALEIHPLEKHHDSRGFFAELLRCDWIDEPIAQANLSVSKPGVIRAWHRHIRGQVDSLVVLRGKVRIAVYDETRINEVIVTGETPQLIRIQGQYWHGTKNIGDEDSVTLYLSSKLYDYENPDELRLTWNTPRIPYDWSKS